MMTLVFLLGQSPAARHLLRLGAGQGPGASDCSNSPQSWMALLVCLSHPTKKRVFSPQTRAVRKIRFSNTYTSHPTFSSGTGTGTQLTFPRHSTAPPEVLSGDKTSTSVMLSTYRSPTTSIPSWKWAWFPPLHFPKGRRGENEALLLQMLCWTKCRRIQLL